eukprot:10672321-Alexandrium_andersonii.AAC.1
MSASLVGSEMCIRDRRAVPAKAAPAPAEAKAERAKAPPCEAVPSAFDAVSYTHLTLPTICSV